MAVLEVVLAQHTLLVEAAFFQDTGRRRVVREDVSGYLHQPELLEGVLAHPLSNGSHDAPAPKRLRQPVTNLGTVRLSDL